MERIETRLAGRIVLAIVSAALALVIVAIGGLDASFAGLPVAQQTTSSPSPSESESPCQFSPAPPPLCPEPSESSSPSPSPSSSEGEGSEESHDSSITIATSRRGFKGRVGSAAKCEPQRNVTVRKVRRGPDRVVGRAVTNAEGRWLVPAPLDKGRYYAKVGKRVFSQGDTEVTCHPARSGTLAVVD